MRVRTHTPLPHRTFAAAQMMFATITAAVVSGAVVQRITMWAWAFFTVCWTLFVYVPLARWIFYTGGEGLERESVAGPLGCTHPPCTRAHELSCRVAE